MTHFRSPSTLVLSLAIVALALCAAARAADWPTYLHDNMRNGITDETLKLPLYEVCRCVAVS